MVREDISMIIEQIPAKPQPTKIVRVAPYARVSSDKDAAFHSLEAQREYYERYIAAHPNWTLVGLYSDNGISGTVVERPEFQRLLTDCRDGKIDLVITKSVTRFARNTVILLETVRELKALGVDCYFEKENLHSISPDGELLLTLLAMYAEEEARSASENQKWRIRKLYEQGKPAGGHTYGYYWLDGNFAIQPAEATIVQRIYDEYLKGKGYIRIARDLNEDGIPAPFGGSWWDRAIRGILINEKYTGSQMLQKSYRENFRTKKMVINHGELRKVFVKNSHPAIINKETYEAVQKEIMRRKEIYGHSTSRDGETSEHLFTGMVECGECGSKYVRKKGNKRNPYWICCRYYKFGTTFCHAQKIPENILLEKTKEALGASELDKALIDEKIRRIIVTEHCHLAYEFSDGAELDVYWEYASRKNSWTPEMRQEARERSLKQHRRKEGLNESETRN